MTLLRSPAFRIAAVLGLAFVAAACARQPEDFPAAYDVPGFFLGLFQGFFIVFALIFSFFDSDISIYAFPNAGWTYDLGFVLGIGFFYMTGFGGGDAARRRK